MDTRVEGLTGTLQPVDKCKVKAEPGDAENVRDVADERKAEFSLCMLNFT